MTPPKPPCGHPEWAVHANIGNPPPNSGEQHQISLDITCTACATKLVFTAVNPASFHGTQLALLGLPQDSIWLRHSGMTFDA